MLSYKEMKQILARIAIETTCENAKRLANQALTPKPRKEAIKKQYICKVCGQDFYHPQFKRNICDSCLEVRRDTGRTRKRENRALKMKQSGKTVKQIGKALGRPHFPDIPLTETVVIEFCRSALRRKYPEDWPNRNWDGSTKNDNW